VPITNHRIKGNDRTDVRSFPDKNFATRLLIDAQFFDFCFLAAKLAQVVELGTTNVATSYKFNLLHDWSVDWELTFNANTEGNFTYGVSLTNATAVTANNNALENLDAGAVTFNNSNVYFDSIACAEIRQVRAQGTGCYVI
jgi:hypothetical protein